MTDADVEVIRVGMTITDKNYLPIMYQHNQLCTHVLNIYLNQYYYHQQ